MSTFDVEPHEFTIPEQWVGKHVSISLAFPIPVQQRGGGHELNFPVNTGKLIDILPGSIIIEDAGNQHILLPKNRIWNIVCKEPGKSIIA